MYKHKAIIGFTFVEILTIATLSFIIAATVLPRLTQKTGYARAAATQKVAQAFASAISIAHTSWIANGKTNNSSILLNNNTIYINQHGWPESTSAPADGKLSPQKCVEVWSSLLSTAPTAKVKESCIPGQCHFLVEVIAQDTCQYTDEAGQGSQRITYNSITGEVLSF